MPTNLRKVRSFAHLVRYLEDELGWPLEGCKMSEITFDYDPEDLGLKSSEAAKIRVPIRQLRPLTSNQPWGIFFIEFDRTRLPIAVLRRILSHLVIKKRASANRADGAAWASEDLLFISAFGAEDEDTREINFAHFHQEKGDLPTLRVLGWDGNDTNLKMEHVDHALRERLRWPDEDEAIESWRKRWSGAFKHRVGHVINTADLLAEELAALARRIRDAASTLIARESENGSLKKLHQSFKTHLIHDLTEEGFADTYAQTIAYGLLTAAITQVGKNTDKLGGGIVAEAMTDMVPVTNPFLKELLQTFLHVGGRKDRMDFDELGVQDVVELLRSKETDLPAVLRDFGNRSRNEDPVMHFFEGFLQAYDKKIRKDRGVFYTPQPVVSYIVRSVHELLQIEFGLVDGLADTTTWGEMLEKHPSLKLPLLTDEQGETRTISPNEPFVQILDPATGTATFPVEVIEVILQHLKAKWAKGGLAAMPVLTGVKTGHCKQFTDYWNLYVPAALLPRLHAFELMMAPYAIAHMKIGLKLAETGYRFGTEERARIYLTNALEPKVSQLPQIGFDALAHEAAAVNEIKWYKRFTVVIGNPPYAGASVNMFEHAQGLVDRYRFIAGKRVDEVKLWLQNDYIKFTALSHGIVERSGVGIWGYITDNSYLDGPTFRGVRYGLAETFGKLRVLDLHGSSKRRDRTESGSADENVFDITQGVAIVVGVCKPDANAVPTYADITGDRESKYSRLLNGQFSFDPVNWQPPFYLLVQSDHSLREEYDAGFLITDAFVAKGNGFMTGRDGFAIGFTREDIEERMHDFFDLKLSDAELRSRYGIADYRAFKIHEVRREQQFKKSRIVQASYRPLDHRWTYFQRPIIQEWQSSVHAHMFGHENRAICVGRAGNVVGGTWDICFCTKMVTDLNQFYRGGNVSLPIYRYPDKDDLLNERVPNFSRDFIALLGQRFHLAIENAQLPSGLTPEDIFHYAYAVFHSPGYRTRYAEFLKIDFPRLPLTGNLDLFRELARLGSELTGMHLMESPALDKASSEFIGGRSPVVEKIQWSEDTVWVDKAKTIGFKGVPEEVWNFHIGGYQVCEKWLKDRKGRPLTADDLAHYQKIVVALSETIRLMKEIDTVIETHGGWPGAFVTTGAPVAADAALPTKEEPKEGLGQDVEGELPLG